MEEMLDKIVKIEEKYVELGEILSKPEVIQDYNKFRDLSKQRKSMEETVELYHQWQFCNLSTPGLLLSEPCRMLLQILPLNLP